VPNAISTVCSPLRLIVQVPPEQRLERDVPVHAVPASRTARANRTITARRTGKWSLPVPRAFPARRGGNDEDVPEWTAAAFAALARVRRARAVHTHGLLLDGRLLMEPGSAVASALGGPSERPAVVRVSKGAGTPGALPDVLGIAVRVPLDDGRVLDLLFSTVGRRRLTRLLLAPATGWCATSFSTFLPYRVDGRTTTLGLDPEEPGRADRADTAAVQSAVAAAPLAFGLTEGAVRPRPVGRLVLESLRAGAVPSFDPMRNAHPRLRPAPFLAGFRERAYVGSRRGRAADPEALQRVP
jgi:hypothetical protein